MAKQQHISARRGALAEPPSSREEDDAIG